MAREVAQHAGDLILYLYGISAGAPVMIPSVRGVDGKAEIESIECSGLLSWISRVPTEQFGESFQQRLDDLEWLAAVSIGHQRVVAAIAETADVLPARLGTMFLSEESLRADISKRKAALEADLRRITGTQEWGVKVFAAPRPLALPTKVRSGKEYLQAKSGQLRSSKPQAQDEKIKKFARELERVGIATSEGGRISCGTRGLQYQASVLLKRTDRAKLEKLLRRFSRAWKGTHKIEWSGPWPPYSFVSQIAKSE
jgi:gas vesicle protein GvpL/GvpF